MYFVNFLLYVYKNIFKGREGVKVIVMLHLFQQEFKQIIEMVTDPFIYPLRIWKNKEVGVQCD